MFTIKRLAHAFGVCVAISFLAPVPAMAQQGYELIDPPQNTSTNEQVEVVEYFWLGCPHCFAFEPTIEDWVADKPDFVKFTREAPALNPAWESHSRSFYAASLLGKETEFVHAMFDAIHKQRKPMRNPKKIAELAAEIGLDKDKFLKTMKSFAVETRMRRALQMAKGAGISGVPSIVVNGKYRTGARIAGGNEGIINVIRQTTETERVSMGLE